MSDLTAARLRELLDYDPETGKFTWKAKSAPRANRRAVGSEAGSPNKTHGYIMLGVDGRLYRAHRLAWLYMHGEWPAQYIDHINGDRRDNRIANLRDVSHSENNRNLRAAKRQSTSGLLGVCKNGNKWSAQLRGTTGPRHIGMFDTPEEAHAAYMLAKQTAQFINR